MKYQILNGDNRGILKTIESNSIDSIVTDPPYGIDFLGKDWDANTGALETYQECLRVLKPGGHILAFSAARTYHHLAITLEQAGFEIRDQIMWIYSSGFPKSQDVGKNNNMPGWRGWGTSLKPAHEPICLARKPSKLSIAKNVQRWGTGALNIDDSRVPYESEEDIQTYLNNKAGPAERGTGQHGEKIRMFENSVGYKNIKKTITREKDLPEQGRFPSNVIGEIAEPYQKYFYCPKVSRAERHTGFNELPQPYDRRTERGEDGSAGIQGLQKLNGEKKTDGGNNHPTVKPVELMKYLIKLVTPPNGIVLDPFNGSGSTGMAAVELGYEYIGIEQDPKYCEISGRRIAAHFKKRDPLRASGLFE